MTSNKLNISLRPTDVFLVVASLGGRIATTGNTSAIAG